MDEKNKKISSIERNEENGQNEEYYGVGTFIWEVVKVFFWAAIIIGPIKIFLFQPFIVQGASMEPNFNDNNYIIVNEIGYKKTDINIKNFHFFTVEAFKEFERGDVIIFKYPKDPSKFFIKRVIGLPGEKIEIDDGKVKIFNVDNSEGYFLNENGYLSSDVITTGALTVQLKEDEYFVLGDNRGASSDSRVWGPIGKNDVVGKALLRAWPFSKVDIF